MTRLSVLALIVLFAPLSNANTNACEELIIEESDEFNRDIISSICYAKPDSFQGIFVDLDHIRIPVPSLFILDSFSNNELSFSLRQDLYVKQSRFSRLLITKEPLSLLEFARSTRAVEHRAIDEFRESCRSELSVNRIEVFAPGSVNGLNLVEAETDRWLLRTDAAHEPLLLALLDASRRLICDTD